MLRRNAFLLFAGLLLIIPIVNCGGSSHPAPVISGTLPNGTVGVPYSGTLSVTGTGPFMWSITGLPATLTFPPAGNGNTVTISGTPSAAATISGTATVTDSRGKVSAAFPFSFTIAPAATPVISGTLPNGNVDVAYSGTLTVTGGVAPFTWNITGLPATLTFPPAGSGNTVTISGTPLATATISGTATVTDSNSTSSAPFPFTFTIGSTPALAITPTAFTLMVGTAVNQTLTVNPATIGPFTWTITSGALPAGLVLNNGTATDPKTIQTTTNSVTITGTPTTAGNFPFIIQVTDSATPANSAQASFSGFVSNSNADACPAGNNNAGLPAGTSYAFLLRGFDAADDFPIAIAGSFTAGGDGTVTAADVDYNGVTLGPINPGSNVDLTASSYSFSLNGSDTRGCLSLVFNAPAAANRGNARKAQSSAVKRISPRARRANSGNNSAKPQGVPATPPTPTRVIFQFALGGKTGGVYTTGNIIEFDNGDGQTNSWASGVMHVQTLSPTFTVSSFAPNFAFGVAGWDDSVDRAAIAGSFAIAGGNISPIFADFNDNGTTSGELTGGSGVINAITTTTGRATANFDIPMPPGPDLQFDAVIYVINANDFYILSSDAVTASVPLLSGRALNTPGTFASGALNGFSLTADEGFDPNNAVNVVTIGTAQFSSTGNTANASFTQSDEGVITNPTFTGTYAVDTTNASSGRVSFTVTAGTATPPVIYLTSGGDGIEEIQGFSVGQDANVSSGILVTQTASAPAFTPSSISGTYAFGSWEDVDGQNGSTSGAAIFTAPSSYSAVEDMTFVTLTPPFTSLGTAVSGSFTILPAGTGTITVGANTDIFVTNGQQIFSIMPTTNSNPDAILATYTNVIAP
jgi:putative Ig domain-containing protein